MTYVKFYRVAVAHGHFLGYLSFTERSNKFTLKMRALLLHPPQSLDSTSGHSMEMAIDVPLPTSR